MSLEDLVVISLDGLFASRSNSKAMTAVRSPGYTVAITGTSVLGFTLANDLKNNPSEAMA